MVLSLLSAVIDVQNLCYRDVSATYGYGHGHCIASVVFVVLYDVRLCFVFCG